MYSISTSFHCNIFVTTKPPAQLSSKYLPHSLLTYICRNNRRFRHLPVYYFRASNQGQGKRFLHLRNVCIFSGAQSACYSTGTKPISSCWSVKLTFQLHLAWRLTMRVAKPLLPKYAGLCGVGGEKFAFSLHT